MITGRVLFIMTRRVIHCIDPILFLTRSSIKNLPFSCIQMVIRRAHAYNSAAGLFNECHSSRRVRLPWYRLVHPHIIPFVPFIDSPASLIRSLPSMKSSGLDICPTSHIYLQAIFFFFKSSASVSYPVTRLPFLDSPARRHALQHQGILDDVLDTAHSSTFIIYCVTLIHTYSHICTYSSFSVT